MREIEEDANDRWKRRMRREEKIEYTNVSIGKDV